MFKRSLFFGGYFGNTLNDRIPSRIFFDMHLGGLASRQQRVAALSLPEGWPKKCKETARLQF
jgi:hypothetical protein